MPRPKLFDEQEVLEKAMGLFWKKGYNATSIGDLVEELRISRASLYATFTDKDELFERAFRHYRETNRDRLATFLEEQQSVKEGFLALFIGAIEDTVCDSERKGCFVINTATEYLPGPEEKKNKPKQDKGKDIDKTIRTFLQKNQQEFEQLFLNFLKKGVKKGEIAPNKNVEAIARMLFTLYNGLKVVAPVSPDREKLLEMVKVGLSVLDE